MVSLGSFAIQSSMYCLIPRVDQPPIKTSSASAISSLENASSNNGIPFVTLIVPIYTPRKRCRGVEADSDATTSKPKIQTFGFSAHGRDVSSSVYWNYQRNKRNSVVA